MSDTWTHQHWPTDAERKQWALEDRQEAALAKPVARIVVSGGQIVGSVPIPPDGEYLLIVDPSVEPPGERR